MLVLSTVMLLVFMVVAFIRGMEHSLVISGDPLVALVHSLGAAENIENSTMPGRSPGVLASSIARIDSLSGTRAVSPELYLGVEVRLGEEKDVALGLARGVTSAAPIVHQQFELTAGNWPQANEVLIGRLAAAKLGCAQEDLAIGQSIQFEGREWKISGTFSTGGSALESELWCPLESLQVATQRQDLSLVAVRLSEPAGMADLAEFCKERLDLEWQATPEMVYYASLQRHYAPIRMVAWLIVVLLSGAGILGGLGAMYSAVIGRVRELAMLQTLGFSRRAIALSIVQEGTMLATAGALAAMTLSLLLLNGVAVRFSMGAFTLAVDEYAMGAGLLIGLVIGLIGSAPPAWQAMRLPVGEALKAI